MKKLSPTQHDMLVAIRKAGEEGHAVHYANRTATSLEKLQLIARAPKRQGDALYFRWHITDAGRRELRAHP